MTTGGILSPVEYFHRWNIFTGGIFSPVEYFHRWNIFTGEGRGGNGDVTNI